MILLYASNILALNLVLSFVGAGILIAIIGFVDDHGHVPARWRLLVHFCAAAWGLYWIGGLPVIEVFNIKLDLGIMGDLIAAVYIVWLLNLYNFMDGIDGIASIEALTTCIGGFLLVFISGFEDPLNQTSTLLLAVSAFGFLLWNFPPAKIFMGDAGSGFIGLLLGLFSIAAAHIDSSLLWGWIILLGAFIADATVTLLTRSLKGKKVYEAHRSHAYQHAAIKLRAHRPVSIAFGLVNLLWLLPISLLVVTKNVNEIIGLLVAYCPLVILAFIYKAGHDSK